jgi:hypothetical protein
MGRPWRRNTPATPPGTARAYQDATKVMHLLALRLRLCPEARVPGPFSTNSGGQAGKSAGSTQPDRCQDSRGPPTS